MLCLVASGYDGDFLVPSFKLRTIKFENWEMCTGTAAFSFYIHINVTPVDPDLVGSESFGQVASGSGINVSDPTDPNFLTKNHNIVAIFF